MTDLPFDPIQLMREHPEKMRVPGGLLTKKGPQDYVGSVPAITGTLFFDGAHLPEVREAICLCFDEYEAIAKGHLTWLWREESPEGPNRFAYGDAPSMRKMIEVMKEDDSVTFAYISGRQPHDAGDWEFYVSGLRGWQAKSGGWGTSVLRFSFPLLYVEENPTAFQEFFLSFAKRLKARHGYGGHGLVLSIVRINDNQPFEAFLSEKLKGLDVGRPLGAASVADKGLKTVSWLTAVNHEMVEKVGGLFTIRSELPRDWFALYDYGSGLIVQAGPKPEAAPSDQPMPARFVLPNMIFKEVRAQKVSLHRASIDGEPRLIGWAADQWLKRFDIDEEQLLQYKARLLDEPKLTRSTTLPDRL
ncbi:type VI immunity family protein [Herbaspirillum rubrisubalbicans]|uniref:type VI immunity family protein n=1 Tax=Herbaspirillum rubrisubalbicans TaxID=80842 RepID=UPI001559D6E8|nr:type VI immunity family protein [Herbaspirillum rubrisubalbicans]